MKIFECPLQSSTQIVPFSATFAIVYGNMTQQYFGPVQLTLDEYLDLILEERSDETETTVDNDDGSM